MSHTDEYPCPCDACDMFAMMRDEYCITCQHHGCGYDGCKCPAAQNSPSYCDYCNEEKETVPADPEWDDGNHICGDCHPSGRLPEDEEWWVEDEEAEAEERRIRQREEENYSIDEF